MWNALKKPFAALAFCSLALFSTGCRPFFFAGAFTYAEHLKKAEEYTRQKDFKAAIAEYEAHIEKRLGQADRPEWENPYFYYIIIGDLYLQMEDQNGALQAYEKAESQGVEKGLLSDRYRLVANWLLGKGRHEEAIETLRKYRDRDPLLFDLALDRIARELVQLEDTNPGPTPSVSDVSSAPPNDR